MVAQHRFRDPVDGSVHPHMQRLEGLEIPGRDAKQ
jgi:hypothetical protein